MSSPSFQRMEELFLQAMELPADQRASFLDKACGDDAILREAVADLLHLDSEADHSDGFLVSPIYRPLDVPAEQEPTLPDRRGPSLHYPETVLPSLPGYEILEVIGQGGMGIVYKARQLGLNRLVALKMLPAGQPFEAEQLARFRTEAEALARVHHPNIVQIYDVGDYQGRPFFTMEYVGGPSLARALQGRPQEVLPTARLIENLARAVHAVHQCGLIHRDLKPGNVLLQEKIPGGKAENQALATFEPKITDFGLAKDQTVDQKLTQSGLTLGTPCYMAPEQVGSRGHIGPAVDIYALGAILYEMLIGRPPFDGSSPAEIIAQLGQKEPPSLHRLRPGVPRDLATICLKCLEKSPEHRYATAWALAEDLRRFQAGEPILARAVHPLEQLYRWCRRRPLVAALALLAATLAFTLVATVIAFNARLNAALKDAQQKATEEEFRAEKERQQIVELHITLGQIHEAQGDTHLALLRFAEALRLDEGRPEAEAQHRFKMAALLGQCPRLVRVFVPDLGPGIKPHGEISDSPWTYFDLRTDQVEKEKPEQLIRLNRRAFLVGMAPWGPFSADDRLALAPKENGGVNLWEKKGKRKVLIPAHPFGPMRTAFLSQGGNQIITVGNNFQMCTWEWSPYSNLDNYSVEQLVSLAQALTGCHLDENLRPLPMDKDSWRVAVKNLLPDH